MRIWSLHPMYLDAKGLVALWRETLLAKRVLEGGTRGYKNHPQLDRFKACANPVAWVDQYLSAVYDEALSRGYAFDKNKLSENFLPRKLAVTSGQLEYERRHLLKKLRERDQAKYRSLEREKDVLPHPLFYVIDGSIEVWERVTRATDAVLDFIPDQEIADAHMVRVSVAIVSSSFSSRTTED